MFKKILYSIILISADKPTITDKIQYAIKLFMTFAPIVAFLEMFNIWFSSNRVFFNGLLFAFFVNILVGIWYHVKLKTFSWEEFFKSNIKMWALTLFVYPLLEVIGNVAGENVVGELFKITIQISTLLYPISKILKNAYVLSEKKYPPSFIMERIYHFEKDGNVKKLFNNNPDEKTPEQNDG